MRIFDFLISENREYDFCNILPDMECNYEELMLILKILDAKHSNSVLMKAAVLDRVQKTEKKREDKRKFICMIIKTGQNGLFFLSSKSGILYI